MDRLIRHVTVALPLIVASCGLAFADTMEGVLGGEERQWQIIDRGGASTANFREIAPRMVQFSLQGHRGERFETEGSLSINFMAMNGVVSGPVEVSYFPASRMFPSYAGRGNEVEIERLEVDGDRASVQGRFRGTLHHVEGIGATEDPDDTLDIDIHFDLTARRQ